jgi:hypothetical protein
VSAAARRLASVRGLSWLVLAGLLAATLAGAATFDPGTWPSLVGDEATYAMQAESLAFDGDLGYERGDYDRFVAHRGRAPDGLILQKAPGGERLAFGKPPLYALWLAPFVRLAPVRGPAVANALLLALAAVAAARCLERWVGAAAALWVAVATFGSVAFAYVFWVHADLFLLSAVALGLSLVWRGEPATALGGGRSADLYEPPEGTAEAASRWRPLARWAAAGALLAVAGAYRPFYLALSAPAAVAAWGEGRRGGPGGGARAGALAAGALALLAAVALLQVAAGGTWTAYGGERQGFYAHTGFPAVDFPATEWRRSVERWGNTSWVFPGALGDLTATADPALWGWNSLYFLAGRNVGVLPYFLPLLLFFAAFSPRRGRWLLPLAVLVAAAGFLLVRPFNFYGGGGAIANRYFLPLYPALWFVAGRAPAGPGGDRRRAAGALLLAALAAPLLLPLWRAPRGFPIDAEGRYRHVSSLARFLPYETTQSHLPGGRDRSVNGLWVKILGGGVAAHGAAGLALTGEGEGWLLVGSPRPLEGLRVDFGPGGPSRLEVTGAELTATLFAGRQGVRFFLAPGEPRAVHPMWWSREPWTLYQLGLTPAGTAPPAAADFTLSPVSAGELTGMP